MWWIFRHLMNNPPFKQFHWIVFGENTQANHLVVLSNTKAPNWLSRYSQILRKVWCVGWSGDRHEVTCLLLLPLIVALGHDYLQPLSCDRFQLASTIERTWR